jgi:hypothetical protein
MAYLSMCLSTYIPSTYPSISVYGLDLSSSFLSLLSGWDQRCGHLTWLLLFNGGLEVGLAVWSLALCWMPAFYMQLLVHHWYREKGKPVLELYGKSLASHPVHSV